MRNRAGAQPNPAKRYRAEPTLLKFHQSNEFVRGVMGPIGSGKSVAMAMELYFRAVQQKPDRNGVRRTRGAVIRNTYPELKSTTIKTWEDWFPASFCPITWAAPIVGKLELDVEDGTRVRSEIIFLSIDRPTDVKKLLSLELSWAWINEAREHGKSMLDMLTGRVGRYPSLADGGSSWSGIIMDTNPPDDDHWWYDLAEVQKPEGYAFFRQPGAFSYDSEKGVWIPNKKAENVANHTLGMEYWRRQLPGKTREWTQVYVGGEYGSSFDGKPVYPEFSEVRHVAAKTMEPFRGLPLIVGWDFGLTPAAVICQISSKGQMRVLDEAIGEDIGLRQFIANVVKPLLTNKYQGMKVTSVFDPSGVARSDTDEKSCAMELVAAQLGGVPAPSNKLLPRREAVVAFLNRMHGEESGFQLASTCNMLRKGFLGGYQFERIQVSGEERYHDIPKKNRFSHVHDALQYVALFVDRGRSAHGGGAKAKPVKKLSAKGWT